MRLYRAITAFIIVLIICTPAAAQISDSLYNALPDTLRPKNKVVLTQDEKIKMLHNADHALISYNYAELYALVLNMKNEMETSSNRRTQVYYASAIASFYVNALDYDKALIYYKKTLQYAGGDTAYSIPVAHAMVYMGGLYAVRLKQDSASYFLRKGLDIVGGHLDYSLASEAYNAYLIMYEKLDLWDEAIGYANKCLALMTPQMIWNEDYTIITCEKLNLFNRLYIETRQKEYADSAIDIAKKIMVAKKKEAGLWYATCYYNLAGVSFASGQYLVAKAYYDSCLMPAYITHNVFENLLYQDKLDRAICMIKLGDEEGVYILETMQLPEKDFQSLRWQNQALYEYARSHGNWQAALKYYEKFVQYTDSVGVIRQRGQVFEVEQKYSVKEKEANIAVLQSKNLQQKAERNQIIVLSAFTVLVFAIITLVLHNRNRHQKMQKELELANQRKTISNNMHDEVNSGLATLKYLIGDLRHHATDVEVKALLADIEEETASVYRQSRDFMHQVRGIDTEEYLDVPALLNKLALRFSYEAGLQIDVDFNKEEIDKYFTQQQHDEMYRIIKEAVANTTKYSGATKMAIVIRKEKKRFYFEIKDNGSWVEKNDTNGGMGLTALHQRAAILKGWVQVKGGQDGTVISGSFPVQKGRWWQVF